VHLAAFPEYHKAYRDEELEFGMAAVQKAVSLGHSLRKDHKIKVRQPLRKAWIACTNETEYTFLDSQKHLIMDELNVKDVVLSSDDSQFVTLAAKPNFRVLGKKIGKRMPEAQKLINNFTQEELADFLSRQTKILNIEGDEIELTFEDVQVERSVKDGLLALNDGEITLALDKELDEELLSEGLAREIVNKINTMRREAKFDVSDRIEVSIKSTPRVEKSFTQYHDFIAGEVLATKVVYDLDSGTEWDLNGEMAIIAIKKSY
jgi:isoleucyl-tRNA synthetase